MRKLIAMAIAGALVMALSGTAAAATPPAPTYHGTWQSGNVCGDILPFSGVWNVTLKEDGTASVSARIFVMGRPHAAWGGNYVHSTWTQVPTTDPDGVFKALVDDPFGRGVDLVFELGGDGALRYSLTNYCENGASAMIFGRMTD